MALNIAPNEESLGVQIQKISLFTGFKWIKIYTNFTDSGLI